MDDFVTRKISLNYALREKASSKGPTDEEGEASRWLTSRIHRIQSAVSRTNTIVTNGLLLLKLFVLHCIDIQREDYIQFTCQFVLDILKVGCCKGTRGRPPALSDFRTFLEKFRTEHFSEASTPSLDHLGNILNYAATDIVRDIHNNITMHYNKYVESARASERSAPKPKAIEVSSDTKVKVEQGSDATKASKP